MSRLCLPENVAKLKEVIDKDGLFNSDVKDSTLRMVFEILWNVIKNKDKKCKKLFSKKLLKALKRHKTLIKYLLNKKKSLKKRKLKYLRGSDSFQKNIRRMVDEFKKFCLEEVEDD